MTRAELEHVIRAAADAARDDAVIVVGSQAILAQFPDAPAELLVSQEADVYPRNHPDRAVWIDRALGDGSQFHETFGYYAHGVGPETARAPAGWEERLIALRVPGRRRSAPGVTGWCLEVHDLVLSKCAAGRERDWEYAAGAIRHGLVDCDELLRRAGKLGARDRARVEKMLRAMLSRLKHERT